MMYFQHFKSKEFFPNCTPDEIAQCVNSNMFDNLLTLLHALDIIRDIVNFPIIITSSYRDKFHNPKHRRYLHFQRYIVSFENRKKPREARNTNNRNEAVKKKLQNYITFLPRTL